MSYFCYINCTGTFAAILLLILLIAIILCIKKPDFKVFNIVTIVSCVFALYFFIPLRYYVFKYAFKHPDRAETILKFSINPHEKRFCYKYLAQICKNSADNKSCNLDKAIYFMEKAINGNYLKYKDETIILAHWYSLEGKWDRAIELNNLIHNTKGASLRNAFIMENEYQHAIDAYTPKANSLEEFLTADLYKKVENYQQANIFFNKAQKVYNANLKKIAIEKERIVYIEKTKKYQTVENYKDWLKKSVIRG